MSRMELHYYFVTKKFVKMMSQPFLGITHAVVLAAVYLTLQCYTIHQCVQIDRINCPTLIYDQAFVCLVG